MFYQTAGMSVAFDSKILDEPNVWPHQLAEPMRGIRAYRDNRSGQCVRHERQRSISRTVSCMAHVARRRDGVILECRLRSRSPGLRLFEQRTFA
jgi:hypothetical protein